ncbi:MAG TPA: ribosome maturation factor RimM [Acidimicrobiales bacterium]|nr:MAG: 16S rRNA processing protein RimM [Actinobacteria bacterium 21-73-9]HQU25728.1 ribosome maturation factor RimM [Acidimicrobiales bacterium]
MAERSTLDVGRVVRAHGLRGEVVVDLWTDRAERLAPGSVLASARGPLRVLLASRHQARWLVRFEGVEDRAGAEALRGVVLAAERLEDPSVIWVDQLFGAEVVDRGVVRGRVVSVEANPASDLLVLDTGALVPLAFVREVEANARVTVEVPEGLFE